MHIKKQITLWLFSLWGIGGFLSAQTYLQKETTRLQNVKVTEQAIADYISVNLPKYDLSSTSRQKLLSYTDEDGKVINLTTEQQQQAFLDAKRSKLRQMYFSQNLEKVALYSAATIPSGSCFNGGFEETTPTAGYTFRSDTYNPNWKFGQNFPTTSVVSPTTSTKVELVSSGVDQYSGLSKVRSGKNAILLNKPFQKQNGGYYLDATSISKTFIVTEGKVSFSFALVLQDPGHSTGTSGSEQPYFQYRLLDKNRNVIFNRVIESDPNNPLFNKVVGSIILHSPWVCATVDTSNYMGQEVTLEVITADCGAGGHWGYAYVDDFCGTSCTPYFGEVQLKFSPLNQNCPKLPLTVCANYVAPAGSTYKSAVLTILKQGVPVGKINAPAQITSKDFCFQVPASAFGVAPLNGDFEFKLDAVFTVPLTDGTLYTYNVNTESANPGPDVSFNNCIDCSECCCPVHLNVTDNILSKYFAGKEASQTILAVNTVYPKGTLIMHAGNSVTLSPGFEAQTDSEVNVYVEGCSGLFKTARLKTSSEVSNFGSTLNNEIELIPVVTTATTPKLSVSPNPTTGIININFGETLTNRKVSIYNYSYTEVASKLISSGSSTTMDLTSLPSGIYMLSYISTNGNLVNFRIFR